MAKNNNLIVLLLVIVVIGAVGLMWGDNSFNSSKQETYIDFNSLDLLNVSDVEVVDKTDYNSLKFNSGFNTTGQEYRLKFDDVNLTNISEYTIEMKFDFSEMVNGDNIGAILSMDDRLNTDEVNFNGSLLNFVTGGNLGGYDAYLFSDLLRNAGDGNNVQVTENLIGRFESTDDLTIKYTINTQTGYLIKTLSSEEANVENTAFSIFSDISYTSNPFDVMDNGELVLALGDVGTTATNSLVGENSSWSIDYIKLSYVE